jgi:phosphoglycolate phosphatase-like HAD superfamily hydrolase
MEQAFEEEFGIPNALEGISMAGGLDVEIIARAFERYQLPQERMGPYFARYLRILEELLAGPHRGGPTPGIADALETLSRREDVVQVLGTGNIEPGAWIKLRRYNLDRFFETGGFGEKPGPRWTVIQAAIDRARAHYGLGELSPDHIYVIGDTPRDIEAGRHLGVQTVSVATGPYTLEELAKHRPDHLLPNFLGPWQHVFFS